ncbi:MAG: GIY-YIG nuclease family protein [Salinivirgaceae bacterium]|jgi:putative endonuclease|nr:GIY-YIG nuclease family protein [Salinivirgaceae bacterium]
MATFYILYSEEIDKFYIGFTDGDVNERLQKHLSKHKGFTSKAKDWNIVFTEFFETKEKAYSRERQIKGWKSRKMIERLVKGS